MIGQYDLLVDPEAIDASLELAAAAWPVETGGILLGYRTESEVVVLQAMEVTDSHAHRFGYVRRRRPAQQILDAYLAAQPPSSDVGWVGDFHSHPADRRASCTDLRSLRRSARNDAAPVCMLVLVRRRDDDWRVDGYISTGGRSASVTVRPTL